MAATSWLGHGPGAALRPRRLAPVADTADADALLDDSGYMIGGYVSLEQLIAESADDYYHETLHASTHGWHEQKNDPWRSSGTDANALVDCDPVISNVAIVLWKELRSRG